ncbi:MAG: IPTL-CTERM sorting domain-containing protein [Phycisphaerae bacterium]
MKRRATWTVTAPRSRCRLECGNKFREPLEDRDDGNREDGDGCSSTCEFEGSVPTISQWGMLVLGTLLLIGLTGVATRMPHLR